MRTLRTHRALGTVLLGAALVRLATLIAYRPALFYSDSWGYLKMARAPRLVAIAPTRPSGYPLALRLFSLDEHSLTSLVVVQHLAGVACGALVYGVSRRLGATRRLSVAGAALVSLDASAIALEQHVLAEALFTILILASLALVLGHLSARAAAVAGLLLAAAALMRPAALFAVPVWLLFVVLRRPGRGVVSAGFGAVLVPLAVYAALLGAVTGTYGLTQADGWFLYARIGQIVDCRGVGVASQARPLCVAGKPSQGPAYFLFDRASPARRAFGGISATARRQAYSNALLRRFALDMIVAHPMTYARLLGGDLGRFFTPGAPAGAREDATVRLPRTVSLTPDDRRERRGLPLTGTPRAHAPAQLLSTYGRVMRVPRPFLALMVALSLVAVLLARRRRLAVFLLSGSALAMLAGSAATAGFAPRYETPVIPLLVCGGLTSATVLLARARSATPALRSPGPPVAGTDTGA